MTRSTESVRGVEAPAGRPYRGTVDSLGDVLGIWAHPDDETYLSAGVMMRTIAAGGRAMCVTATRGEQGSTDPGRWPAGAPLAEVRTRESAAAMRLLGVTEHHWLDYPDGGLPEVPPHEAVARIVALVDRWRPDTIVTFAPTGMTGHPDHRTVSAWADAVAETLQPPPAVLHAVHAQSLMDRHLPRLLELDIFLDDALPDTAPDGEALTLHLSDAEMDTKWAALVAQPSQTEALFAAAGPDLMRDMFSEESFVRAKEDS